MKRTLLWMVFSSNRTSKLLTWKSTISVRSIRINSSKEAFCNLFKSVVFPAFPQPTMMHLTWQTEIFPLLRNCLSLSSSISGLCCCFPSIVAVLYPDSSFCFSSLWIGFDFCVSFLTVSDNMPVDVVCIWLCFDTFIAVWSNCT